VRVSADTASAQRKLAALDGRINAFSHRASHAGRAIGLGFVGGMAMAVKSSLQFGEQMRLIQTQAGGSARDVKKLSASVLELARHSEHGPADLAKALFHLKSVGMSNVDAMRALKVASEGATMGIADLEGTTNVLAGVWKTNIKGAGDFKNVMATLSGIVGSGNLRMEDLIGALGTGVLPLAKKAGLSIQDFGAALATATARGIPAQQFATRFSTALMMLANPSKKAETAMQSIGLSGNKIAHDLQRPQGLLVALKDIASHEQNIHDKAKRFQLESSMFGGVRGAKSIMVLLDGLGQMAHQYDRINRAQANYNRNVAAAKAEPINKLRAAWSQAQVMLIKVGATALPAVVSGAQSLVSAFEKVGHIVQAVVSKIGGWQSAFKFVAVLYGATKLIGLLRSIGSAAMAAKAGVGGIGSAGRWSGMGGMAGGMFANAFGIALTLGITAAFLAIDWSRMAHDAMRKSQMGFARGEKPHTITDRDLNKEAATMFRKGATKAQVLVTLKYKFGSIRDDAELKRIVARTARIIQTEIPKAVGAATAHVKTSMTHVVSAIGAEAPKIGSGIAKAAGSAKAAGAKVGTAAGAGVKSTINKVGANTSAGVKAAVSKGKGAAAGASAIGSGITAGVLAGAAGLGAALAGSLIAQITAAISAAKAAMAIHSPSGYTKKHIGIPLGQGIVAGFLEGTYNLPDKMSDRLRAVIEKVAARLGSFASSTIIDRFTNVFDRMIGDVLSAFDAKTDKILAKIEAKYKETPAEKKLRLMQDAHDEEGRQRAISDAQKELVAAIDSGDADRIKSAQQALRDAQYEETVAALEKQAEAERASADKKMEQEKREAQARRDLQRRHLEDQLMQLERYLERHPKAWHKVHLKILRLLRSFGIPMHNMGALMGKAFVQGLQEEFGGIERVIAKLAKMLARLTALLAKAVHSKPKKHSGGGGGAGGIDDIEYVRVKKSSSRSAPSIGGGGGAGGGGGLTVNVYVAGSVTAERDLAKTVHRELMRYGRRNLSTGLAIR
jgi:TP901 family phage tail tape measure protein